jgi:outer membrane protein assembly factor BamB
MKKSVLTIAAAVVAFLLAFVSTPAAAHAAVPDLIAKWQQTFPDSVRWYVRTSLGILLVRSGTSLTAVDGVDGTKIWSLPEIEIGGWLGKTRLASRGDNLLEIPGYSILLINRAKLNKSKAKIGELLALDLWTGQLLWSQPELDNLATLVPRYESGKVLLVTTKPAVMSGKDLLMMDIGPVPYPNLVTLPYGTIPFRAGLSLMDPLTGKTDWRTEYPRNFAISSFFDVREIYGRLLLYEADYWGAITMRAVDFGSGNKLWEFNGRRNPSLLNMPLLPQNMENHIILEDSGVVGLDPNSGDRTWNTSKIGSVAGLVADGDAVLGVGSKGAFALDAKTGAALWQSSEYGHATNPLFYKDGNILAFCTTADVIVLDASSGHLLRKIPLYLDAEPFWISRVGKKFLIAFSDSQAGVYDLEAGKKIGFEDKAKGALPSLSFLMRQYLPSLGDPAPPPDIRRQLQQGWPSILERAKQNENSQKMVERLQPFLGSTVDDGFDSSDSTVYATSGIDNWRLWHVNPETGLTEAVELKGSQPDASLAMGLAFFVDGKTLKAVEWKSSYRQIRFEFAPHN